MNNIWELKQTSEDVIRDIESFEYREIKETHSTQDTSEDATYNFHILDTNAKILYSKGYIHQELRVVKGNGDSVGEENVTLVNGGGLLRRSIMTVGAYEIDSDVHETSLMLQVMGLINFTPDYTTSEATNMFYYIDTSDSAERGSFKFNGALTDATTITNFFANLRVNDERNEGFTKRWIYTRDSQSVHIFIPLKYIFGFLKDYEKVITGFDVKFQFQRNSHKNMLYTNAQNPNYKVQVKKLSLWLPYVKFNSSVDGQFTKLILSDQSIDLNWRQPRVVKSNILENSSGSCNIPATTDEVMSLYVVPQYDERNENFSQNNMLFDNLDMIDCWLMVNNVRVPNINYTMDFEKKDYSRLYAALLDAGLNNLTSETGCLINYETFRSLYPIICFNLSFHEPYVNVSNLMIEFHWRLKSSPQNKKYVFYFVLIERKRCKLNMAEKKITMLNTLRM